MKWAFNVVFIELKIFVFELFQFSLFTSWITSYDTSFETIMVSSSQAKCVTTLCFYFVIWFKIILDTQWFKWDYNQLDFIPLNYDEKWFDFEYSIEL